ncbi:hypothetical protein niasHT_020741 [Heterodera trifolii]|uniref:SCP domain-containing protein n=1 Tax=Heterodera trifolii TaxID=157864 RepID=A0ABD2JIN3_9BILA
MGHHNSTTFLFGLLLGYFLPELAAQLSKDEQDYCVSFSNNLRSTVATGNQQNKGGGNLPSATNMLELAYNETIGQTAQAWADKCQFSHSNTAGLGENIYWSTKEGISNTEALNKAFGFWWNEAVTIGIPEDLVVDANNFEPIGHFTQMAWHSTTDIGCGVAKCQDAQWKLFVVCNYWPPGNVLGQMIYGPGATCSACEPGWTCDAGGRGLCVRQNQ